MRATGLFLAKHVPLIKFVGGPHVFAASSKATVHPCAPDNLLPGSGTPYTKKEEKILTLSRSHLSKRFRYGVVDDIEIEEVNTGGAEIVY